MSEPLKLCIHCRHFNGGVLPHAPKLCTRWGAPPDPVTGSRQPIKERDCSSERAPPFLWLNRNACGPTGRFFEEKGGRR